MAEFATGDRPSEIDFDNAIAGVPYYMSMPLDRRSDKRDAFEKPTDRPTHRPIDRPISPCSSFARIFSAPFLPSRLVVDRYSPASRRVKIDEGGSKGRKRTWKFWRRREKDLKVIGHPLFSRFRFLWLTFDEFLAPFRHLFPKDAREDLRGCKSNERESREIRLESFSTELPIRTIDSIKEVEISSAEL